MGQRGASFNCSVASAAAGFCGAWARESGSWLDDDGGAVGVVVVERGCFGIAEGVGMLDL